MTSWPQLLQSPARSMFHLVRRNVLSPMLPRPPRRQLPISGGVCVCGLLNSASGLGKSARLCLAELERLGLAPYADDISGDYGEDAGVLRQAIRRPPPRFAGVKIFHLNPPMLGPTILRRAPHRFFRTYNIGYWAWEFDVVPDDWIHTARALDEIFVTSSFVADALRRRTRTPITIVHHPIEPVFTPVNWRAQLGLRRDDFVVHLSFNYGSSFERKNPLAAIAAFIEGLGAMPNAHLVIKTAQSAAYPQEHALVAAAASAHPRVHIVDDLLSDEDTLALIACADVLISMHRSEGFGLPMAEAMYLGVPVVATNWSGNTDFCSQSSAMLVDASLIDVRVRHAHIDGLKGARWAEPDVAQAAQYLRRLFWDRGLRAYLAQNAREEIVRARTRYSYERALEGTLARLPVRQAVTAAS